MYKANNYAVETLRQYNHWYREFRKHGSINEAMKYRDNKNWIIAAFDAAKESFENRDKTPLSINTNYSRARFDSLRKQPFT